MVILMKKILFATFVFGALICSFDARAITPYIGLDYMYSDADFGQKDGKWLEHKFDGGAASLGLKLTNNFAIEGFYQQTVNNNTDRTNVVADGDSLFTNMKIKAYGGDIVQDILNVKYFEVLGSVGYARYEISGSNKYVYNGKTSFKKYELEGDAVRLGIGAQINFTEHYAIRGMYRYAFTNIDEMENIQEISVGVRLMF